MKGKLIAIVVIVLLVLAGVFYISRVNTERTEIKTHFIVNSIENIGKLELVKYNIQNVIEHEKMRTWLPNARTLLVAVGEAVICIDLTKINADDVKITRDSLSIILPEPEICYVKIDHQKSKIYSQEYGLWESTDLVEEVYRYAENNLRSQVAQSSYQIEAEVSAKKLLTPIFNNLGYKKVGIIFKPTISFPERYTKGE